MTASGIEVELEYPINVMNLNADGWSISGLHGADTSAGHLATWDGTRRASGVRRPCGLFAPRPGGVYFAASGASRARGGGCGSTSPEAAIGWNCSILVIRLLAIRLHGAQPLVYNETWDLAAHNAVLRAD